MSDESDRLLREIFANALELNDPVERERYLAQACGPDAKLRQTVEALVAAHQDAGGFLRPRRAPPTEPLVGESPGDVIGHYKLLEEIGEGGFGVVFLAEQREPIRRRVALKVIKPGMDTKQVIARFEAERQALALMDHPNIARVFDAGATETGRPYFVMELVPGVPITQFCDANELAAPERLKLFQTVCEAVQHAHQKGIIHRDLKPSNILVTLHDGKPVPKVIDFGTAKALQQPLTEKTRFTAYGKLIGTPQYMSPEQAELSGLDVDTRADIYSLGVLLYELLTGTTPFEAERLRTAAFEEMMRIIRQEEPPKPSTRISTLGARATEIAKHRQVEPSLLQRSLRGDLDWIVMKALEKDRARRYETANTLLEDVQRHLNHQPVLASPPGATYRARKFIRRHQLGVAMATVLTLALAAGLTAALIGFAQARRERDRAERLARQEAAQRLQADAERDRAVAAEVKAEQERNHSELLAADAALDEGQSKLEAGDSWGLLDMVNAFDLAKHNPDVQKAIGRRWSTWHGYWDRQTIAVRPMHGSPSPDHLQFVSLSDYPPNNTSINVRLYDTLSGEVVAGPMTHESAAVGCAFSPDGRLLATVTEKGVIHLWDRQTGKAIRPPCETGVAELNSLSFSADGRYLVAFSSGNSGQHVTKVAFLRLGDVQEPVHLVEHRFPVGSAQFSPDGELIAVARESDLQMWRTSDLTKAGPLLKVKVSASVCEFSADGTRFAFIPSGRSGIALADPRTMQVVHFLPKSASSVTTAGFSHDGRLLASFDWDCNLELWKTESEDGPCAGQRIGVRMDGQFAFSRDDSLLACGDSAGTVHVLRTSDGEIVHTLHTPTHPKPVFLSNGVLAAPAGRWVPPAGRRVHFWDLTASPLPGLAPPDDFLAHVLEFDRSGEFLAVGSEGELRLWTMQPSPRLERVIPMPGRITALTWLNEEKQFMAFSDDGSLARVEPLTGTTTRVGNVGRGSGLSASLSPDGRKLVLFNYGEALLVDTRTGEHHRFDYDGGSLSSAFRPDSQRLARGTADWRVRLYDTSASTNSPLKLLRFPGWVEGVAYSPDGNLLAVCVMGNTLHLYDSGQDRDIGSVRTTSVQANLVRFSADGSLLAVAGPLRDGGHAVKLWHVDPQRGLFESGVCLGRGQPIWSVAFSPDNRTLIVGGLGSTRLWRLPPQPKNLEEVQSQTWKTLGFRMDEQGNQVYLDPPTNGVEEIRTRLTQEPEFSDTLLDVALKLPANEALTAIQELADQHPGITLYQQLLRHLYSDVANSLAKSAIALRAQGKLDEMEKVCRELAAGNDAGALNELAWNLATLTEPNLRDGQWAVKLAEQAVAATGRTNAMYLDTLAAAYAQVGQFTNAVNVQQEAIALLATEEDKKDYASRLRLYESGIPYHDHGGLAWQAHDLLDEGKFAEAEPFARECLALREKLIPDDWLTFQTRCLLGRILLEQKKYAEAEPLLLSACEGMKQREATIPPAGRPRLRETLQRLVQLYEATDRPAQAAEWKQRLANFEKAEATEVKFRLALRNGRSAAQEHQWQEAAENFRQALDDPVFDWRRAYQELPTAEHWMALAFVRAGDSTNHLALCRKLAVAKSKPVDDAGGVLRAILLPSNPGPEPLTLASNALPVSESLFTNAYKLAWYRIHRGLLECRSGRYAEALGSARQAAEWRGPFCHVYALILQSMACKHLGQDDEARKLWQEASDSIPELGKKTQNLTNIRNLLLLQLLLDEASGLLGPEEQQSPPQPRAPAEPT